MMERILINDVMIVTMENRDEIINRGYILIEDGIIKEVIEGEYPNNTSDLKLIDGSGCVAIPGLINCHTHIPMTLLRGYGEGLPLMRWLNERIWPFEAKLNGDDIKIGTELGILEMIKSGTTTFVDMYFFEEVVGRVASDAGIRACLGSPLIGDMWESQLEESIKLKEVFRNNPLIKVMAAPHSPYTCNKEALKKVGDTARRYDMPVHIHISETEDECNIVNDRYGTTSTRLCEEAGLFDGNSVIAAHCVHMTDEDIEIINKYNVSPAYNPVSNMKLASGMAPVGKMLSKGINVSIGTDGASSNNSLNMLEEMKTAAILQKLSNSDATVLSGYETMKLATVNGARAIGMEGVLGKIKSGYAADIVLLDIRKPHMVPLYDIYSNIVFSAQGGDVKTVLINGRVVMENYDVKFVDEEFVVCRAQGVVEDILKR